jgi:crotonobetainyl-CoA:carnitine CoA-transferase CaiB-like acyl-CoA transferase
MGRIHLGHLRHIAAVRIVGAEVVKVERPRPVTTFRIRKEHDNPFLAAI